MSKEGNLITIQSLIPYSIIADEVTLELKSRFYSNLADIKNYYDIYEDGVENRSEGAQDYIPSDLHYKKIAAIIDKETRFIFSNPISISLINETDTELLNKILNDNEFNTNILKACKDCFISGRIAILVNFDATDGITIVFLKAYDFLYEMQNGKLTKFVCFWKENQSGTVKSKNEERWRKKTYIKDQGIVKLTEIVVDGYGTVLEDVFDEVTTGLTEIPAQVILNDGLLGDTMGRSEVGLLQELEEGYSFLSNIDIDALRKSMNPIKYTVDADSKSTEELSTAPGSYWDLQTDTRLKDENGKMQVGMLESQLNYASPIEKTLGRLEAQMHEQAGVPLIDIKTMHGIFSSMKALKAIYWDLEVRSNEKWLVWETKLTNIVKTIIEGSKAYPNTLKVHSKEKFSNDEFNITLTKKYALPEDIEEDRTNDEEAVANQVMSKKSYMIKWYKMTPEQVDEELKQIQLERQLLEDSYSYMDINNNTNEE